MCVCVCACVRVCACMCVCVRALARTGRVVHRESGKEPMCVFCGAKEFIKAESYELGKSKVVQTIPVTTA
jgi:hypothetical protein